MTSIIIGGFIMLFAVSMFLARSASLRWFIGLLFGITAVTLYTINIFLNLLRKR